MPQDDVITNLISIPKSPNLQLFYFFIVFSWQSLFFSWKHHFFLYLCCINLTKTIHLCSRNLLLWNNYSHSTLKFNFSFLWKNYFHAAKFELASYRFCFFDQRYFWLFLILRQKHLSWSHEIIYENVCEHLLHTKVSNEKMFYNHGIRNNIHSKAVDYLRFHNDYLSHDYKKTFQLVHEVYL